jgi:large subunit ribosomal protein L21
MEAVFRDGGRQYRVKVGDTLNVDYRPLEKGSTLYFGEVLYLGGEGEPQVGAPKVEGARVQATVLGPVKDKKLISATFRRRKGLHTRTGHRQPHLKVKIEAVLPPS